MIKLSLTERREHFLLLLAAFVLAMTLLGYVLFYSDGPRFAISKEDLALRIHDDQKFEESANLALKYVDSASAQIKRFDPTVQAVFIENDIKKTFSDINALYAQNSFDSRYSIFAQGALFYENYYVDRRELKGNLNDIERISKNLDDCIVNRKQLQQTINMMNSR